MIPALVGLSLLSPELAPMGRRLALIYGGVIFSFLGGIQWGFALSSPNPRLALRRLGVSIVPSLWAFMALSLPSVLCTLILMTGVVALLVYEWLERGDAVYPSWYLPLRLQLTTALVLGLALTLLL